MTVPGYGAPRALPQHRAQSAALLPLTGDLIHGAGFNAWLPRDQRRRLEISGDTLDDVRNRDNLIAVVDLAHDLFIGQVTDDLTQQ